jgi:hypothetical protein
VVLLALVMPAAAAAQGPVYLPLDDPASAYVDALVVRGAFPRLSALERPYLADVVRDAADSALRAADARLVAPAAWYREVLRVATRYAGERPIPGDSTETDGLRASLWLTPYVTARTTGRRELMLAEGASGGAPGADLRASFATPSYAAVARLRLDRALKTDPEFIGKKDRSITARMEEAYLSARWRYAAVSAGRVARNWGPGSLDGLQIGHYADSYDHLHLRLGVDALHLSSIVARLDDMTIGTDSVAQRYFTAHRLAGRWRQLEIAASEAVVYGGIARGFEPSLANPLTLLDLLQYTERKALNVNYGLDVAWRTARSGTYGAQLLIDDFQVDRCGVRCKEPASIGYTVLADGVPLAGDARSFASYTRVTNLTYRSANSWERYTSFELSLGRGQSDYDEVRAGVELAPPLGGPLRLYGAYRRQGEGDYRKPFPPVALNPTTPLIFAGVVMKVRRAGAQWTRSGRLSVTADVGYNWVSNAAHVAGRSDNGFEGRVRVSIAPALAFATLVRD